jgi:glyoxylase-like metal-dependent hydrolase (beta-lactamase superfamily II)/rhodanese-related sulfurtransferase
MIFRQLFDHESSTYTYLLADEGTGAAVLVDPVREQIERDIGLLEDLDLRLVYTLETHVHADHVTASGALRQRLGSQSVLGAAAGAGCADVLVQDGETLSLGAITIEARHTPGHTSGCVTYVAREGEQQLALTGDTLLIRGCGRTDFQQGSASTLYDSVHEKIFSLPDATPIYPGHDYKGRTMSTVGEEKRLNPRLGGEKSKQDFEQIMEGLKLAYPKKIDVALPANLHCGVLRDESWAPITRTDDGVPEVGVEWVHENPTAARRIDVRRPEELAGDLGAMDGAQNVPLDRLPAALREWSDREQRIVMICRSGGRSGAAARLLEQAGFVHVASMHGGMLRWNALELPHAPRVEGEARIAS